MNRKPLMSPSMKESFQRSNELIERCIVFAENVHITLKKVKVEPANRRPIEQCSGSCGSIGANYAEATEAESKRDFIHKIGIAKKEIKETLLWLRLLATTNPEYIDEWRKHWSEGSQLLLIFSKITWTYKKNQMKNDTMSK